MSEDKNLENLSDTWLNQGSKPISYFCADQWQYLHLFDKHFSDFSGKILEIGPGTAYLCKHIMNSYPGVDYTILDVKKNIDELKQRYIPEEQAKLINFVDSSNYREVFEEKYDLLVSTFCLPETPKYYWKDILDNIRVDNCFIIDDGKWCDYEDYRNQWLQNSFESTDETEWIYIISGYEKKGIQLSIGKKK